MTCWKERPGEVEEEGDVLATSLGLDALDLLGYRVGGAD